MKENTYYYSAKTGGFYNEVEKDIYEKSINGWPSDAVEITDDEYKSLFDGQAQGKEIKADSTGYPILTDAPEPPPEEPVQEKSRLLLEAYTAMKPLELAVKHDMATDEDKAQLEAWERYSVLLSRVDTDKAPDIEWPASPADQPSAPLIAKAQRKKK